MVAGRPPKYTTEIIEREAELLDEWVDRDDNLYFKEFSLERGYPSEYMSRWAKENERFHQAYTRAKDWQELKLLKGGLNRTYDASFCKFTMQNVCRWSDKQIIEHTTTESAIHPSANNTSADLINDPAKSQ